MLNPFLLEIGKRLNNAHACWMGIRLRKKIKSSDPIVKKQSKKTFDVLVTIGGIAIGLILLFFLWPYLLLFLIIYTFIKMFS